MATVDVSDSLLERYDQLVQEIDGFDDTSALLEHILRETAEELKRHTDHESGDISSDDESVEDRLRELGYIE